MGIFDIFRRTPQQSAIHGAEGAQLSPFSDLVQYVRSHIWPAGPQSMPSFAAEEQAFSEGISKMKTYEENFHQMDSRGGLKYFEYETPSIETISSDSVFNIRGADSPGFWDYKSYTKSDYMELASHLPEIQERLANGESLESIRTIPELTNTVDAYYGEKSMISVSRFEDGYQFGDEGRHRMMAAKEMGCDVPVKVIGEYVAEEEEETNVEEVEVTEDNKEAEKEAEKIASEEEAKARKELEEEEVKVEKELEEEEVKTEKELEEEEAKAEKEAEAEEEKAGREAKKEAEEEIKDEVKEETANEPKPENENGSGGGEDLDGGMEY